jgi:hypothetical protein
VLPDKLVFSLSYLQTCFQRDHAVVVGYTQYSLTLSPPTRVLLVDVSTLLKLYLDNHTGKRRMLKGE